MSNSTKASPSDKTARLARLLARRDKIGTEWAERFSHGLPGVGDLTIDLAIAEMTLTDDWPGVGERWTAEWALADIRKLHDPRVAPRPGCSICARRSAHARN